MKFEWLRRSGALLFDGYWPPFAPVITFDPVKAAKMTKEMNAEVIRFGTLAKWAFWPNSVFPMYPELEGRDLLRETLDAFHAEGIKVMAYMGIGHALPTSLVNDEKPGWAMVADEDMEQPHCRHFGGPDVSPICINGPYRQEIPIYVQELLDGYDVDGLYIDGPYHNWIFLDYVCQCDNCRTQFKAATNLDLPTCKDQQEKSADKKELLDAYWHWEEGRATDLLEMICKKGRAKSDDIPILMNSYGFAYVKEPHCTRMANLIDGFLREKEPEGFIGGLKETGRGIYNDKVIWNYTQTHSQYPRMSCPDFEAQNARDGYVSIAQASAPIVAYGGRYYFDTTYAGPVRDCFAVLKKNKGEWTGTQPVKFCALPYTHFDTTDRLPYLCEDESLTPMYQLLDLNRVQAAVVPDAGVLDDAEKLAEYKMLALPSVGYLTDAEQSAIRKYVQNGGTLLATGVTSLEDADGNRRTDFALADLFGVNVAETYDKVDDEIIVLHGLDEQKKMWDVYCKVRGDAFVGVETSDSLHHGLIPTNLPIAIKAADGAEVLADIVIGMDGRAINPAVVLNTVGKGKVVYINSSMERVWTSRKYDRMAELFGAIADLLIGDDKLLTVDAPSDVMVTVLQKPGARYLHLVDTCIERDSIDVSLKLRCEKAPAAVTSCVTDRLAQFEYDGKCVVISGLNLNRYECLKIVE